MDDHILILASIYVHFKTLEPKQTQYAAPAMGNSNVSQEIKKTLWDVQKPSSFLFTIELYHDTTNAFKER